MFIQEFRSQFYEIIKQKKHALVLVNLDVDAVCACKILLYLFECDHVKFSVLPVSGWKELRDTVEAHSDQNKMMVLINCGGTRSLIDTITPPDDVVFFIIDSHRPFDLDNVFDDERVKILAKREEIDDLNCPPMNEIYYPSDDESEEDGNSSDSAVERSPTKKRNRMADIEQRVAKKQRRARWNKQRGDHLWNYYENSWYSVSSALCMFELAHDLSKSTAELLWCAVVGVTSQYVDGLITDERYISTCVDRLRVHVKRFNHLADSQKNLVDRLRISFDKELALPLYRHWSLYSSMEHDPSIVCRLRLWTQKGARDMHHFLADLGLTLGDCQQLFSALSSEQRKDVVARLQTNSDKYKLTSTVFGSFIASAGYCNSFNAADFARALGVQLEVACTGESAESNFFSALSTMSAFLDTRQKRRNPKLVQCGIETCKTFLEAVVREVYVAINQNHVLPTGAFLLVYMSQGPDLRFFTGRHSIASFARFLLRAFVTASANKFNGRPLVVAVPLSGAYDGWYEVLGIMPLNTADMDGHNKSFIGRAFDRVCDRSSVRVERDHFDSCLIRLKAEDRGRFFNALQAVLETVA
uniref:CDC45-like protein n=1 Tax=Plectus sambesii TaxID=2011161 RepID=A0A914XQN1_9BILA